MKNACDRAVSYEPENQLVFVDMENGKICLSIFFSNECETDAQLFNAMTAWVNDSDIATISPHFSISSPVDYLIEGHQLISNTEVIDKDSKPIFDAVKREMLDQIKRIDSLIFE